MATVRFKPDPKAPVKLPPQLEEVQRRMTPEEIETGSLRDSDNPPMTEAELEAGVIARRVRQLREKLALSQVEFARRYRLPIQTLRHWEAGRRQPDQAALAYLDVISAMPDEVARTLAA